MKVKDGGTILVTDGPRYESSAESNLFKSWGAHLVGMTSVPEVSLNFGYKNDAILTFFVRLCLLKKLAFATLRYVWSRLMVVGEKVKKFRTNVFWKYFSRIWKKYCNYCWPLYPE